MDGKENLRLIGLSMSGMMNPTHSLPHLCNTNAEPFNCNFGLETTTQIDKIPNISIFHVLPATYDCA